MSFHLGKPILVMLGAALISGSILSLHRSPQRADLVLWVFANPHAQTYRSIIDQFENQTGKTVSIEHIGLRAETVRLESMFMSGQSGDILPDVVEMEIGNVGKFFLPPVNEIGFEPLNDYLKAGNWDKRIVPSRLATWSKDGVVFGVPHDVHPVTITYRKDLFDEAGIDLEQARTWPEYQEMCVKFQEYWKSHGYPLRHAMDLKEGNSDHLIIMLLQRGLNVVDEGEKVRLNEPQVAQTVAQYAQMIAGPRRIGWEGSVNNGVWISDMVAGNLCAFFTADWRVFDIVTYGGDKLAGKMHMMALPKFEPTDSPTSTWGGTMIGISRRSAHKDEAWKLIQFLYLSQTGLEARLKVTNILPPVIEMWNDPAYHQPDPFFNGQKINELYVKLAKDIPARHASPITIMAQIQLSLVVDAARKYVEQNGTEGLEAACQKWLDEAAQDVKAAVVNARFEDEQFHFEWSFLGVAARMSPYLFVLPFVLLFIIFLLYPVARSMMLSLYKSAGPREKIFVGLANYSYLLHDRNLYLALANTIFFTLLYLILYIPISLGLALLLNNPSVRFRNVFRFTFFSTHLVGQVFVAIIFILLLSPRQGLVDRMIGAVYPPGREFNWRGDSSLAMPGVVLASLWISIGYGMVYFLAALQAVDHELYEAAQFDGAGRWGRFWHITLPSIKPVLIFIILVATIGSLQLFELPYVLFDPPYGPGGRTLTIVMYLYQQGFEAGLIGQAAAIGWVLVLLIFVISIAQLKVTGTLREI